MPRHATLLFISLIAVLTMGVSPSSAHPSHKPNPPSGAKPAPSSSNLSAVLSAYERIRAVLASDKLDGLVPAARQLEAAARKAELIEIAKAASPLVKAHDLAAARTAFGKLSRRIVALVQADPTLRKRFHVFECPMVTEGENQWIQPTAAIENPYMGKSMPSCGTKK